MFNKQESNEEQNFWVSYADLMAGLLFVFILVLGVILMKYMTIENKLSGKNDLVSSLKIELSKNKNALIIEEELNKELMQKNQNIILEIENKNIIIQDTSNSLELSKNEALKLKNLILNYKINEENNLKTISKLKEEIIDTNNTILLNNKELSKLASIILLQKETHQSLVDKFSLAKDKIKTLTGIRIKVIKKLKLKLGKSVNIDNKSGAIRFYSNILFDQNKFKLKEKSKKVLSKTLKKYIKTILYDKKIRKHIDKIIIEGHTNTDGTYLYNLELSQKRALEVMKFLYSIETKNKKLLAEYISASGRSYSDVIKNKNKKENKNASRRIEIKFQLKNEQSIKQLSKYFDKKK